MMMGAGLGGANSRYQMPAKPEMDKGNKASLTIEDDNAQASTTYDRGTPQSATSKANRSFAGHHRMLKKAPTKATDNVEASQSQTSIRKGTLKKNGDSPISIGRRPFTYYISNLYKHFKNMVEGDYFAQLYKEHFYQTYQSLSFCKFIKPPDLRVITTKKVRLAKKEAWASNSNFHASI